MPRQPDPGAGASIRAPIPSPSPSSPLSPQRYRALRSRYNALLVALYERSSLTLREIAMLAGRTDRAVQMLVRALGCRPRNARTCRPGTNVGVRRAGPRPPPLNAPSARRVAAAFEIVARELAASARARAASETQRATARAERRVARTQLRVIAGAARSLRHIAAAMEDASAIKRALTNARPHANKPKAAKRPSREEIRQAQQRVLRAGEARMHEAQQARVQARDFARDLARDQTGRREAADAVVPRNDAPFRPQPRIRRL